MNITIIIVVAGMLILALVWIRFSIGRELNKKREGDQGLGLIQNQINAQTTQTAQQMDMLRNSIQQMQNSINSSLQSSNKTVGDRLDAAANVIRGVNNQLGQLEKSTQQVFDIGKNIAELDMILRAPKLRGNIGELFLGDLLGQILPSGHFTLQHHFQGGEAVDAVIRLQNGLVPIDSKFPLENFRKMAKETDEKAALGHRKVFIRDVKKHIDKIASQYIRTDEGTFDFALMYIPAENIYYETILTDRYEAQDKSLFNYALERRVIPVSPNSFYAYLQTILLGLKGMRIEEEARNIIDQLGRLKKEFERFEEVFRLVGTHLDKAGKQYINAEKQLNQFGAKLDQIDQTEG